MPPAGPHEGELLGAGEGARHRRRIVRLQSADEANLTEQGHDRVRQRVMQVTGHLQPFPDNGGVARLVGESLHLMRAQGDAALQARCPQRLQPTAFTFEVVDQAAQKRFRAVPPRRVRVAPRCGPFRRDRWRPPTG